METATGIGLEILGIDRPSPFAPGMCVTWGDGSPLAVVTDVRHRDVTIELQVNLVTEAGQRFPAGSTHVLADHALRMVN